MSSNQSRHANNGNNNHSDNTNRNTQISSNATRTMSTKRNNEMAYHYAGKVHVRGLLRRVWRPRYLALGDDGYLRYHESIPPIVQQQSGSNFAQYNHDMINMVHTHRPKTILAILDGARVINPYSVVDQHVALPQGVHGFVFRGRPVEMSVSSSAVGSGRNGPVRDVVPPRSHHKKSGDDKHKPAKAVVNAIFPKGTSRRKTAQKLAKAAINPDVLCGIGRNCERGINSGSSSSSLVIGCEIDDDDADSLGEINNHFEDGNQSKSCSTVHVQSASIQSREYLCAVSTAAEAESWVVALRWAARCRHMNKEQKRMNLSTGEKFNSLGIGMDDKLIIMGENYDNCESSRGAYGEESKESLTSTEDGWCKADQKHEQAATEDVSHTNSDLGKAVVSSSSLQSFSMVQAECTSRLDKTEAENARTNNGTSLTPTPKAKNLLNSLLVEDGCDNTAPPKLFEETHTTKPSAGATIVVTKVCKLQVHLNAAMSVAIPVPLPGNSLDIKYEIELLLLKDCHMKDAVFDADKCLGSNAASEGVHPQSIEERTIIKSIQDIFRLISDLKSEFGGSPSNEDGVSETVTSQLDTIQFLEEIESSLMSEVDIGTKIKAKNELSASISDILATTKAVNSTVDVVNHTIRSLSTHNIVCSSRHFQEFLCLGKDASTDQKKAADAKQNLGTKGESVDQIVRSWIAQKVAPSFTDQVLLYLAVTIHHRFGGPVFSLILFWTCLRFFSVLWCLITDGFPAVVISVETYVTLVFASFYFGHGIGMRSSLSETDIMGLYAESIHSRHAHVAKPTSVLSSEQLVESLAGDDDDHSTIVDEIASDSDAALLFPGVEAFEPEQGVLSSPLPMFPENEGISCWSIPDHNIFMVRSKSYLTDRLKMPSSPAVFECRGVDIWITDNAERNISRHPSMLGGKLQEEDTFIVNFLLPFANLVAYFTVKPVDQMPPNVANVWQAFIRGDQEYRDGKLKLLPVVVDGPWIVKKAVGPGTSPAMIGRDLPLQYYFTEPTAEKKGVFEVDVLVTASRIARGILNVVKGHTKSLTIAFAFIIEAAEQSELPETVLCAFQVHSLHLEDCPCLPEHLLGDPCD